MMKPVDTFRYTPQAKRYSVVQMTDVTGRGGAEKALVDLALRLDPSQFRVSVVATRAAGNYQPLLDEARAFTHVIRRDTRWDTYKLAGLAAMLRRERVHILHTHLFGSNTWGRILGKIAGVPVVIAHEHWSSKANREVWVDRLLYRLSDRIIAPSEASKRTIVEREGIPPGRITVVYNGVDSSIFAPRTDRDEARAELGSSANSLLIGTVGRLSPEKGGVDMLILAAALLREEYPDTRLVIVGDGPLRPLLESIAETVELPVTFTGTRADVPRLLGAMDVFVLPSLLEAMPIALLEAMAMRLPTVSTKVGGVPEIARDGVEGLLVAPGSVEALLSALRPLAMSPGLRCRLGEAAQNRVRSKFTIERMVERVERLYRRLLSRKGIKPE